MFVSSYNTYISTNTSDKIQRKGASQKSTQEDSFSSKLATTTLATQTYSSQLPLNYISNFKVLNNQQKLQQQSQETVPKKTAAKESFTKINASINAKDAYSSNTKLFSFLLQPKTTLNQTPTINKKLPSDFQEAQEKALRNTMVNTYQANENYYQITSVA
jgi:hypothetical protein